MRNAAPSLVSPTTSKRRPSLLCWWSSSPAKTAEGARTMPQKPGEETITLKENGMKQVISQDGTAIAFDQKGKRQMTHSSTKLTRVWLAFGMIAGPLYLVVGLTQALTRPGFDITRHDLSLLSNGDLGWIQITNLVVSGLLVIAGALGMRRALRPGRAGTWGPLLVGVYGLGLIGAGLFVADPVFGFPPGTAVDAHTFSWHGLLHFASGGIGFLGLIAATMVFA